MRDLEERFDSQILPLFKRRTREVGALLPELYLHGLAQGDFELTLRGPALTDIASSYLSDRPHLAWDAGVEYAEDVLQPAEALGVVLLLTHAQWVMDANA